MQLSLAKLQSGEFLSCIICAPALLIYVHRRDGMGVEDETLMQRYMHPYNEEFID